MNSLSPLTLKGWGQTLPATWPGRLQSKSWIAIIEDCGEIDAHPPNLSDEKCK